MFTPGQRGGVRLSYPVDRTPGLSAVKQLHTSRRSGTHRQQNSGWPVSLATHASVARVYEHHIHGLGPIECLVNSGCF
jgi:hypothetical protein